MILGIGTDLVDITRMSDNIAAHGDKMAEKILTSAEFSDYQATSAKAQFLASRFAAKEACAKALGTGFRDGLSLKHIEVSRDPLGRPLIAFYDRALDLKNTLNIIRTHLSLSHEHHMAMAVVILEA